MFVFPENESMQRVHNLHPSPLFLWFSEPEFWTVHWQTLWEPFGNLILRCQVPSAEMFSKIRKRLCALDLQAEQARGLVTVLVPPALESASSSGSPEQQQGPASHETHLRWTEVRRRPGGASESWLGLWGSRTATCTLARRLPSSGDCAVPSSLPSSWIFFFFLPAFHKHWLSPRTPHWVPGRKAGRHCKLYELWECAAKTIHHGLQCLS